MRRNRRTTARAVCAVTSSHVMVTPRVIQSDRCNCCSCNLNALPPQSRSLFLLTGFNKTNTLVCDYTTFSRQVRLYNVPLQENPSTLRPTAVVHAYYPHTWETSTT